MSINRLLVLAALLAIGACGPNPNAFCAVESDVDRDTEETLCTVALGTPVVEIALPDDGEASASVQR